jgi:hypothetical protein
MYAMKVSHCVGRPVHAPHSLFRQYNILMG